jgi:hypothetical protein
MTFDPFKQAKLMKGLENLKSFSPSEPDTSINDLRALAGVREDTEKYSDELTTQIMNKREYERQHNIRPGDKEWFKLHFAQPKLTGEDPFGRK